MMRHQNTTTQLQISTYDEYLRYYFPSSRGLNEIVMSTPKDAGIQMANEVLRYIQEALIEEKDD